MTDQKPRVLIIDDEPTICRSLSLLLKDTYDVETAEGGEAALETLKKRSPPDIVLLDVMMPDADGTSANHLISRSSKGLFRRVLLIRGPIVLLFSREKPPRKMPILARWLESLLGWRVCSPRSTQSPLAIALF